MKTFLFMIGAQRCGTTYLASNLCVNGDVHLIQPYQPETKYFHYHPYGGLSEYAYRYFGGMNADVVGEKSTIYYEKPDGLLRAIAGSKENVKILVSLRSPWERAISNYYYSHSRGHEPRNLYNAMFDIEPRPSYPSSIPIDPFDYILRSRYSLFFDRFKMFDVLYTVFEEMVGNEEEINRIQRWLGVKQVVSPVHLSRKSHSAPHVDQWEVAVRSILRTMLYKEVEYCEDLMKRNLDCWRKQP